LCDAARRLRCTRSHGGLTDEESAAPLPGRGARAERGSDRAGVEWPRDPPERGPGDRWSPETLLVGALADCFILTFRAVANASSLPWIRLRCEAEGVLDRVERMTRFTAVTLVPQLESEPG